jgi:hypothetical protein
VPNDLSFTAMAGLGETHHETAFIDRFCGLHFLARSDLVCVGDAFGKPEYTYRPRTA